MATRVNTLGITDATIAIADLSATGTPSSTTFLRGDNSFAVPIGSKFGTALLHVRDEKAAGTDGGTFTSGSFQTRTLNTVLTNEISGASLSSNQIILPAGTYYINAQAPACKVNIHKLKLRNITDSTDALIGYQMFTWDGDENVCNVGVTGRFTISAQKTFEIQHICSLTKATTGFGRFSNYSLVEVYADAQIWKVA
jgi:hypothetical protein